MNTIKALIESAYQETPAIPSSILLEALTTVLLSLEKGILRVAEKTPQGWEIHTWIKEAILLYFKYHQNQRIPAGFTQFYDKIPLQVSQHTEQEFKEGRARMVPGALVRRGAHIGPNCILMPSFVNIGAFVGEGTMVDTWATVGSCAQIGRLVHLSGGVGIGGVLEPLQATPTIIEDNCFIGARSEIVEGVVVEENCIISMGVFIGQSTKIYDREADQVFYGRVPAGSVVVPGSLPSNKGRCHLNAAIIVKHVDAATRQKVGINHLLREVADEN